MFKHHYVKLTSYRIFFEAASRLCRRLLQQARWTGSGAICRRTHPLPRVLPLGRRDDRRTVFGAYFFLGISRSAMITGWYIYVTYMAMDQYLLIPFLVGWTSIYQLFWCSPGVQGFDTLPHVVKLPFVAKIWDFQPVDPLGVPIFFGQTLK